MADRVLLTARQRAVVGMLIEARCEVGHPHRRQCFEATADSTEWCWPCWMRWAKRKDAARFVAPKDDVR